MKIHRANHRPLWDSLAPNVFKMGTWAKVKPGYMGEKKLGTIGPGQNMDWRQLGGFWCCCYVIRSDAAQRPMDSAKSEW